jgi:hypothetical protein
MHIAAQSVELGDDHGTLELAGSGEEAINRSELFCTDSAIGATKELMAKRESRTAVYKDCMQSKGMRP